MDGVVSDHHLTKSPVPLRNTPRLLQSFVHIVPRFQKQNTHYMMISAFGKFSLRTCEYIKPTMQALPSSKAGHFLVEQWIC